MTFHHESGGVPACIAPRVDVEGEFQMLSALRDRTTARLYELLDILLPAYQPLPPAVTLPRSGVVQASADILLFKGGRGVSA